MTIRDAALRTALGVVGAGAVAGTALTAYAVVEARAYTLRRVTVPVLRPGSPELRVLHVSDVHMTPGQNRKQDWLRGLAGLRPDLVVNTGDNLGHADGLRGIRAAFDPLRGIPGVFVHGSNDLVAPSPRNPLRYFTGPSKMHRRVQHLDTDALDRYLADELGWIDLDNTAASLTVAGVTIDAFGVGDAHRNGDDLASLPPLIAALPGADLRIGVTHAPYRRVLDAFTGFDADVVFAGHTHGGQVRVPGVGALVANCDLPLRQARGLSEWAGNGRTAALNVSAGIGHSIYAPVRFACRPEASFLTLLPR